MLARDEIVAAMLLLQLNTQIAITLFLLLRKTKSEARYMRANKLNKNGTPRKRRQANFARPRSILDREKLQKLPDKYFAGGNRMPRWLFEQLLSKIIAIFDKQVRQRKRHRKYRQHHRCGGGWLVRFDSVEL